MRKGIFSSFLSSIFGSKRNILIILVIIFIIIGGLLVVMDFSNPNIHIKNLSNSGGHFIHPQGQNTNDYYEYRMYAKITGMPNDGEGYYCVCTFYNKTNGLVLEQSTVKLDNYSKRNPTTYPCGVIRSHNLCSISKVEISVFNGTGALMNYKIYNWDNNPSLITNITDSIYSDYF